MKKTKITEQSIELFQSLFVENVKLFHRLAAVVEDIHGREKIKAGQRGVLRSLEKKGSLTVPELARMRPVSRQHIQVIINELLKKDIVELIPNPAHKRSKLVNMTEKGKKLYYSLSAKEEKILKKFGISVTKKDLVITVEALKSIREAFESEQWSQVIKKEG